MMRKKLGRTALRSRVYLILAAGLGAGYVPLVLLPTHRQVETGFLAFFAFPFWLVGGVLILWCFWDFTFMGRGTPFPLDPPKELVITGPYRHVRNPIYIGVLVVVIGYFLWFKTVWMVTYAVVAFLGAHSFVISCEELALKKKFGVLYENYCKSLPRWIARLK